MVPSKLEDVDKFIRAGNARFTILNTDTGNRFTYRMRKAENKNGAYQRSGDLWFVSVLTGPENTNDYTYIGVVDHDGFRLTAKSRFTADAQSVKAFDWFFRHINNLPANVEVYHEGRCGRCGRTLTVPESVASGFGPECIGRL